jgi:hypothetical protein
MYTRASGLAVRVKVVRFVFFFDFSFRMTYRFTFALSHAHRVFIITIILRVCYLLCRYIIIICSEVFASTVVRLRRRRR